MLEHYNIETNKKESETEIRNFLDTNKIVSKNYDTKRLEKKIANLKNKLTPEQIGQLMNYCSEQKIEGDKKIALLITIDKGTKNAENNGNNNFSNVMNMIIDKERKSDKIKDGMENPSHKRILSVIYDHIDKGIDISKGINLEGKVFLEEDISEKIREKNYILSLDEIAEIIGNNEEGEGKNIFDYILIRYNEKLKFIIDDKLDKNPNLSIDDIIGQLHLEKNKDLFLTYKQYLFIKNKAEKKGSKSKQDSETLTNSMVANDLRYKLSLFGFKVSNIDENRLRLEEERQRLIEERTQKYIEAAQKRIEARNNQQLRTNKGDKPSEIEQKEIKTSNLNNASGAEIVASSNLNLDGIQIPEKHEVDKNMMKIPAFDVAWNDYIKNIGGSTVNIGGKATPIKSIISQRNFREIYNIETNTINENNLITYLSRIYKKPDGTLRLSQEEIAAIKNKIQIFSSYFDKSIKNLSNNFSTVKNIAQKQIKVSAVGSVIDNIRGMMKNLEKSEGDNNSKGFEFTSTPPIEQRGDSLIIPCKVNGTKTKIRYDMKSGKLYINSFITKNINGPDEKDKNFKIGQDNYKEIGELKSINNIVNEYYEPKIDIPDRPQIKPQNTAINNKPPINKPIGPQEINSRKQRQIETRKNNKEAFKDMLGQEIDLLGKNIEKELSFQEKKNSIIIKLMKSFNIIKDGGEDSGASITIGGGSKLFELLEAIENSHNEGQTANFQTLESFESLLTEIINFSGLQRGENRKYPEIKKLYEKEYHEGIKKKIQDIKPTQQDDPSTTEKTFDSNFNPELIKLIVDSTISGTSPNQKIDFTKINEAMKEMKKDNKNNENADLELEKELEIFNTLHLN